MKVTLWLWMWPHSAGIHRLPIEATATKCCQVSWFAAKCSRIFSLLAAKFSIWELADFLAGFYQTFKRFSRQQIPDQNFVSTVFQDKNIYVFITKIFSSWRFNLGNTRNRRIQQLPSIVCNFVVCMNVVPCVICIMCHLFFCVFFYINWRQ